MVEANDDVDNGVDEAIRKASFEEKRKQHYKVDFRAMKAALEEDDEDDEDEDEEEARNETKKVEDLQPTVQSCWAVGHGPEALHGGPKAGAGFAQSTGGTRLQVNSTDSTRESSTSSNPVAKMDVCSNAVYPNGSIVETPVKPKKAGLKTITWDEETIAEHDLLRGTRQKIEEPNTPWLGSPSTSGRESAIHAATPESGDHYQEKVNIAEEDVEERLNAWYKVEKHRVSIQEQWGEELADKLTKMVDAEGLAEEERKAREFAEKRKQHYKMDLKAMRAAMQDESEDEESEEDE